ncbi:TPA: hypothetical protein DIU27_04965 [Candidatus Collierbacteria bacterium]|uniref:Uncharacterized protein n=1 Tax=Candidatus Collierbacteria bacterium GW2011_GWB2_44_22 TaxID=1618387 RepID=A0A0G1K4W4_9BACT|nr:MAG: hypothetical protein UW31_C0006G0036 [Candidatus Collierbacteria bacterium GW2011_GWA2_44_13]KKT51263.1 MAG: hypothetical protein UW42_C0004G0018 [Candidatus Collierbacteria bacterium GW2011_GWB1_44_197]KKT51317.1 MAG: hypothetical protein UW44_C0013G0037 [Candidatus Collierbacteria bacterium GW2011_GWB2_44_22]KKT61835.1 MAG: hypothetical protein UW56_C0017G0018 [Candidatus Collierbacteria bacterium GW2011_GWD1_44_27]KKT66559.1 MAG: hypothetical protein UW58_C0006G0022 [Candidatus Colli
MNTGLGLSFWRIVNEEGANGWAQIYARIPFDDSELNNKGALFGVVFGENKDNWAERDSELMAWVEAYFNRLDSVGKLSDFGENWRKNYSDLSGVWVWINSEGEKRLLKIVKWGVAEVVLTRSQKDFNLSANLLPGKVLKGNIEEGDKLVIFTGGLKKEISDEMSRATEDMISKWNKELREDDSAFAGMIFDFGKVAEKSSLDTVEAVEKSKIEERMPVVDSRQSSTPDLAEDRIVGPLGLKEKLINWWMKFYPIKQKMLEDRSVVSKRKKWSMWLGILFLLVLALSLITGSVKMKRAAELKEWKNFSEPIEKSLLEASSLVSINPTGAKKLIEDIRTSFDLKKSQFSDSRFKIELLDLDKKINDGWTVASGEKESLIEEILKIDLVRQGFKGNRLGFGNDNRLLVLDSSMGVIMTAEVKTKDIKVVAGKGEGLGWIGVVGVGSKIMVLNNGGVRNAMTGVDLIKFDSAVSKPVTMGDFGGNLYILDQGNKEIYKYSAVGEEFGDRTRWLKQDQLIGFEPVDMAMDSDIWVVSEKGQVERFRRGSREPFSLSGVPVDIKITRIAVEQEGSRLALLSSSNGVVILCSKDTGVCDQILKSSRLVEASDIEFDRQGALMVLIGGTVGVLK